jgi:hypothetical protein
MHLLLWYTEDMVVWKMISSVYITFNFVGECSKSVSALWILDMIFRHFWMELIVPGWIEWWKLVAYRQAKLRNNLRYLEALVDLSPSFPVLFYAWRAWTHLPIFVMLEMLNSKLLEHLLLIVISFSWCSACGPNRVKCATSVGTALDMSCLSCACCYVSRCMNWIHQTSNTWVLQIRENIREREEGDRGQTG